MLKHRIITAAILIPIFILFYLFSPVIWFARVTAAITLLAGFEWAGLSGLNQIFSKIIYVIILFCCMMVGLIIPLKWILFSSCLFWSGIFIYLFYINQQAQFYLSKFLRALLGIFILVTTWVAICAARSELDMAGIMLFVIVAIADTSAYFFGKRFGRHLLAPNISPKKTREGVAGAMLIVLLLSLVSILHLFPWRNNEWLLILAFEGITLISVAGDLFESAMKRIAGVKDSGTLLKGHGGILDRIDGICSAAPFFALLIYWHT